MLSIVDAIRTFLVHLEADRSVEPIYTGRERGYLVFNRDILRNRANRYDEYSLFHAAGRRLRAIGGDEQLKSFNVRHGSRNIETKAFSVSLLCENGRLAGSIYAGGLQ